MARAFTALPPVTVPPAARAGPVTRAAKPLVHRVIATGAPASTGVLVQSAIETGKGRPDIRPRRAAR